MLAIAGQTAGPNWLNFFEGTHVFKFYGQRRALKLVNSKKKKQRYLRHR